MKKGGWNGEKKGDGTEKKGGWNGERGGGWNGEKWGDGTEKGGGWNGEKGWMERRKGGIEQRKGGGGNGERGWMERRKRGDGTEKKGKAREEKDKEEKREREMEKKRREKGRWRRREERKGDGEKGSGFEEDEPDSEDKADKGGDMVPMEGLATKSKNREKSEDKNRNNLLNNFELHERERSSVAGKADAIGRNLATILKKSNAPGKENDENKRRMVGDNLQLAQLEMAVPGKSHKDVGDDEKKNSVKSRHGGN